MLNADCDKRPPRIIWSRPASAVSVDVGTSSPAPKEASLPWRMTTMMASFWFSASPRKWRRFSRGAASSGKSAAWTKRIAASTGAISIDDLFNEMREIFVLFCF